MGRLLDEIVAGRTKDAKVIEAKETLARFVAARCVNCRRTSHDDIRIERSPKNERPELTPDSARKSGPGAKCTTLPDEVEDALRRMLCTVTGLDPLDALMLLHVARGGTPATFGRFVNDLMEDARGYGAEIGRATAKAKWSAICRRFAPFSALRSWGVGHGGRASDGDGDEVKITQTMMDL